MFNHQIPVSYTPAQAGINPTALSFPNATFHLPSHKGPLYLIEFKSGRTELFFVVDLDTALKVKVDDLVIVEADRGEDFADNWRNSNCEGSSIDFNYPTIIKVATIQVLPIRIIPPMIPTDPTEMSITIWLD